MTKDLYDIARAEGQAQGTIEYRLPRDWHSPSERQRRLWALTHERGRLRRQAERAWKVAGTLYHAAQSDPEYLEFARAQRQRAEVFQRRAREIDDAMVKLLADKARGEMRKRDRSDRQVEVDEQQAALVAFAETIGESL